MGVCTIFLLIIGFWYFDITSINKYLINKKKKKKKMLELILKIFIRLLNSILSATNHTKLML